MSFALPSLPASKVKKDDETPQMPPPPPLNYTVPEWSPPNPPMFPFALEVVKSGAIIDSMNLTKSTFLVGRLPTCDVSLEHSSVSRQHALFQHGQDNLLFLFDLGSAHGTFLNKRQIEVRTHVPVRAGDVIKFGQSSRLFVVSGGKQLVEEEATDWLNESDGGLKMSALSHSNTAFKKSLSMRLQPQQQVEHEVSWGFAEDATNEDEITKSENRKSYKSIVDDEDDPIDFSLNDFSSADTDAYYYRDSKKALKTWCDSRGMDMTFTFDEEGHGVGKLFVASIQVILEGGHALTGTGKGGRKKEAERNAALDACVKLDKRGILRSNSSSTATVSEMKRKLNANRDDDDTDSFYDRTDRRKKQQNTQANITETFETLSGKLEEIRTRLQAIDEEIVSIDSEQQQEQETDEIDQFLSGLDSKAKLKQKRLLMEKRRILAQEHERVAKMAEAAKPHDYASFSSVPPPHPASFSVPDSPIITDISRTHHEKHDNNTASHSPSSSFKSPTTTSHPLTESPFLQAQQEIDFEKQPLPLPDGSATLGTASNGDAIVAVTAVAATTRRRRNFVVLTRQQVDVHEGVQGGEEMVDAVVGGGDGAVGEAEKSKYGY